MCVKLMDAEFMTADTGYFSDAGIGGLTLTTALERVQLNH